MHGYWTHIGNVGGPTLHVILALASIMTQNFLEVLLRISMCVFSARALAVGDKCCAYYNLSSFIRYQYQLIFPNSKFLNNNKKQAIFCLIVIVHAVASVPVLAIP